MKYKYPKKITVGAVVFKIIYDYKSEDASFAYAADGNTNFVKFGMKNHEVNKLMFLDLIIHEFKEIIQVEQSTRVYNRGLDGYQFIYGHAEHTDLCGRLAGIIKQFIV